MVYVIQSVYNVAIDTDKSLLCVKHQTNVNKMCRQISYRKNTSAPAVHCFTLPSTVEGKYQNEFIMTL